MTYPRKIIREAVNEKIDDGDDVLLDGILTAIDKAEFVMMPRALAKELYALAVQREAGVLVEQMLAWNPDLMLPDQNEGPP